MLTFLHQTPKHIRNSLTCLSCCCCWCQNCPNIKSRQKLARLACLTIIGDPLIATAPSHERSSSSGEEGKPARGLLSRPRPPVRNEHLHLLVHLLTVGFWPLTTTTVQTAYYCRYLCVGDALSEFSPFVHAGCRSNCSTLVASSLSFSSANGSFFVNKS